jgi:hypothetical protein
VQTNLREQPAYLSILSCTAQKLQCQREWKLNARTEEKKWDTGEWVGLTAMPTCGP